MKSELKKSLEHMEANPTTGTAHNQQVISSQVQTIFAIDRLEKSTKKLRKTMVSLEHQGQRNEEQNITLQKVMVWLTVVMLFLSIVTIFRR